MKKTISDLAVFGGKAMFGESLHVGLPGIGQRERFFELVNDMFDRRWLTNDGPFVQELERKTAERLNAKYCVAVCNGTIGLQLAAFATDLTGEVIVPSFTFISTAHALQWEGLRPVFCDVREDTHNIDPEKVEELITDKTSAIVGVHLWGRACDVEALEQIANRHRLVLLFDAAHAFMCSANGRMIGNSGDAEILSFHATKFFNTAEGGAIITNNADLAVRLRQIRNFGFGGASYDHRVGLGINAKMSELSAAMGLTNLESIDEFLQINLSRYQQYHTQLEGIPGITLLRYDPDEANNYQYIIAMIDYHAAGIHRDVVLEILHAENILARRYFYPGCHNVEPYSMANPEVKQRLPVTEKLAENVLSLPTGTGVTAADIDKITGLIRFIVQHSDEINMRREKG